MAARTAKEGRRERQGRAGRQDDRKGRDPLPPRIAIVEADRQERPEVEIEPPRIAITKEQLLADHKQHFDQMREVVTEEYMKRITQEIEKEMEEILKQCIECLRHYKIGLHDCKVRTDKHYCRQALLILAKIYGVTKMEVLYETDEHYSGLQWHVLVFGPKVDK